MSENKAEVNNECGCEQSEEKKPGFLGKMIQGFDRWMKRKSEEKAAQSSCCGSDGKGDKCC